MKQVLIVAAERTSIEPRNGRHRDQSYYELGGRAVGRVRLAIENQRGGDCSDPAFFVMGNAMAAGGNPARMVGLASGLSCTVPSLSVDTQCCSGLDAIGIAFERLRLLNRATFAIAGGAESCSQAPIRLNRATGRSYEEADFTPWPNANPSMIEAAIHLQAKRRFSDDELYDWAIQSHQRNRRSARKSEPDSLVRDLTARMCRRAASVKPYNPTLMAPLADGAAFVALQAVSSLAEVEEGPAMLILSYQSVGTDPLLPGLAVAGLNSWLAHCQAEFGFHRSELIVSLMESFCAQVLANIQDLGLSREQVNPWGGLLARGHPIGASGGVLVCDLFDHLALGQFGLAAIPAAGGQASGLLVKRIR